MKLFKFKLFNPIQAICKILRKIAVLLLLVFLPAPSVLWADDPDIRNANRIISTSPSITETLFALGLGHRVVGVTDFCMYPSEARQLPSIGGMTNPNMEALVTLQPDLVLHLTHSAKMARYTKALGVPSMSIKMDTLDDILRSIELLGSTFGIEEDSKKLLAELTAGINFYKNKLKDIHPQETLLLLGDSSDPGRDLYATGPNTFLHELLEISGGKNILHDSMAKYPRLTKEYVIEKSPEVIIEAGPKVTTHTGAGQGTLKELGTLPHYTSGTNGSVTLYRRRLYSYPWPPFGKYSRTVLSSPAPKNFSKFVSLQTQKRRRVAMNPHLEVKNLVFAYDSEPILKDISLSVEKGEFIGLIGPNGSGKSTLLKLMGGVMNLSDDAVWINDQPINTIKKKVLARDITWISQEHPMVFPFTVQEIVLMGRHPYLPPLSFEGKEDYRIARDAMEITQTSQFSNRYFSEISGGEKQRVMLASAIAQEPEIMLLDEPTSALDLKYQIQILNILKRLNEEKNITLILAMHDLNLASRYCRRLILLDDGAIVRNGTPAEVLKKEVLENVYGVHVNLHNLDGEVLVHPITSGS
ncbi:MAG: helical backbone metal receptor [Nitrospinia bacterium]